MNKVRKFGVPDPESTLAANGFTVGGHNDPFLSENRVKK